MYIAAEEEARVPLNCLYILFALGQKFYIVRFFKDSNVEGEVVVTPSDWQEFCVITRLAISTYPYSNNIESVRAFVSSLRDMSWQ